MKVRGVRIRNFRGIRTCDWNISTRIACLVGPGDSTKSTIIDAIGVTLSPSYRVMFSDADFYECDSASPIQIDVVVSDLPSALIEERAFGLHRSGVFPNGELSHDPVAGAEDCLVIRLRVDESLEPTWNVIRPDGNGEEEKQISASQRGKLGFFRIRDTTDRHLRWGRGSALTALTEDSSELSSAVREAQRQARQAVFDAVPSGLSQVTTTIAQRSRDLGANTHRGLRPGLDPTTSAAGSSMLLHEDDVPISSKGLGTRRLTGIAIQASGVEGESVIAIDEIELGLEPHRLAHLLRYLGNEVSESAKQVFTTTHSPVVVTNLKARDLAVVSNSGGETEVRNIVDQSGDSQAAIRSCPEGLLARRILIGEGATEVGLVRGLCRMWDDERQTDVELSTSVTAGFQIVDGRGGAGAIQKAKVFHQLGYTTGILIDNDDRGVDQEAQNVADLGVELIRWESGRALEEEIVQALSEEGVVSLVEVAIAEHGEQSVRHEVERNLEGVDLSGAAPADWSSAIGNLDTIKKAVAFAAKGDRDRKKPGWFKRQDGGELLAGLLEKYRPTLADTSLAVHLTHLRRFVYGDHSSEKE